MSASFDPQSYWEWKILPWEKARYEGGAWRKPGSWTLRRRMRESALLAGSRLTGTERVLELGCGSGILASRLEGKFGSFFGIDFAAAAIERANGRVRAANVSFERGDVLSSELPECEIAIFLGLLDWLEPEQVPLLLGRIRARTLLFSYTESGLPGPYSAFRAYYDWRFGRGKVRARAYSRESILEWLRMRGARKVDVRGSGLLDPGRLVLVDL